MVVGTRVVGAGIIGAGGVWSGTAGSAVAGEVGVLGAAAFSGVASEACVWAAGVPWSQPPMSERNSKAETDAHESVREVLSEKTRVLWARTAVSLFASMIHHTGGSTDLQHSFMPVR